MNTDASHSPATDDSPLIAERRAKLSALRKVAPAFPNDFKPTHHAASLLARHGGDEPQTLDAAAVRVRVAGRLMLKRIMGKASFATLQDSTGRIQIHVSNDVTGEQAHAAFKHDDLGDWIGCEGVLFKTRTGELTIKAEQVRLLVKSLRPLPDKFHGVADQELRYRQRYVDLIVTPESRERFALRSKAIAALRGEMLAAGFMEVETPMLHPIPGGAAAKPFVTHHNALDQQMYLRIAPELYLKRLLVGGFERVFEINRNFRNEG
ncbi:MAG: amino acid--tRNA ligase-related protein, partial [Thiomonas sp.]